MIKGGWSKPTWNDCGNRNDRLTDGNVNNGESEGFMKLLRIIALTAVLMITAIPSLTNPTLAGSWGGWSWGGVVATGQAPDGTSVGYAPNACAPPYDHAGYPAYGYGYGTSYSSPVYGGYRYVAYHPVVRRHVYATPVRRNRRHKITDRSTVVTTFAPAMMRSGATVG
jgi:hypothetical protein